jgi:geranylgeranyl pyrophosphate synthase
MVIHTFNTAPKEEADRLKEILALKTNDTQLILEAVNILKKNKSLEFATNKAEELVMSAWKELDSFLPSSTAKNSLKGLVDFLIKRDH